MKCTSPRRDGGACGNQAIPGGRVCKWHGGSLPVVKRAALVRQEISQWVPGDITEDPGEVLLRLVTQSSRRAGLYAQLLEQAYDHANLVGEESEIRGLPAGVQALIGGTWSDDGDGRVYQTGEQIRGLVALEAAERDRCANFASKAIAAGLAERAVRLAERQGQAIIEAITVALDRAGVVGEARVLAQNAAADHLLELSGRVVNA